MGISCLNNGRSFLKSLSQPMSLTTIAIIFISFVLIGALGISVYRNQADSRIELCRKYGVSTKEIVGADYETSLVICIVSTIIFFILTVLSSIRLSKSTNKTRDIWFPVTLGIITIVCLGLAVSFNSKNKEDDDYKPPDDVDITVIRWCQEERDTLKDQYQAIAVIMGLGIAFFITYITDLLTSVCIVY